MWCVCARVYVYVCVRVCVRVGCAEEQTCSAYLRCFLLQRDVHVMYEKKQAAFLQRLRAVPLPLADQKKGKPDPLGLPPSANAQAPQEVITVMFPGT
jgi:hypothetical protein